MKKSTYFYKAYQGALIADALAMPVHWYYDREAIDRDYGVIDTFHAPKNPHPDSIFWRSSYDASNEKGNILHDHIQYWGVPNIHYHQELKAGENTLNFQLAKVLYQQIIKYGEYDLERWAETYVEYMLNPAKQRDTYVEEYHRGFFERYANGKPLLKCAIKDEHIGGLAQIPALLAGLTQIAERAGRELDREMLRQVVKSHVALTHRHSNLLRAADCLVRLLWSISAGNSLHDAIKVEAGDWFSSRKAETWSHQRDRYVIGQRMSTACYIDQAFPASIYLAWKYHDQFSKGVQANAEVGGDNCHRGAVVGALLGSVDTRSEISFSP